MSHSKLPTTGDVVANRYRLGEKIGSGGFGIIFKARQNRKPHQVALKVMSYSGGQIGPEELKRRYRREAVMASNLVHPHSVRQFDFGEADDYFYLAMELLDGETLGERIERRGPLGTELVIRIARATLEVLHLAHQKDIVHRDLKPHNIMLCRVDGDSDVPKLLDFGAAKTTHGQHDLTSAGIALGSPGYMAPEILRDEDPRPASDLYSLAVTLGEAIVGHMVVPGEDAVDRARNQLSPDPLELPEALTKHPLYPWLSKALEKDLGQRFASATQMLGELEALEREFTSRPSPANSGPKSLDTDFSAESTVVLSSDSDAAESPTNPIQRALPPEHLEDSTDSSDSDDFDVGPTVVQSSPTEDTDPLTDTQIPPGAGHDADLSTVELSNPLHRPSSSTTTDDTPSSSSSAPDRSPSATGDDRRVDTDDRHRDPEDDDGDNSQYFSSFQSFDEPLGDEFDEKTADDIEPTADKDYKLVKTTDGREVFDFMPIAITGLIILILVTLILALI